MRLGIYHVYSEKKNKYILISFDLKGNRLSLSFFGNIVHDI
jgi:hypothetical protein